MTPFLFSHGRIVVSDNTNKLFALFESKEELLAEARGTADKVEDDFRRSLELYFIARYFVAVHESRYSKIPIQVWNEYRNALDHFFRSMTDTQDAGHLQKMEGHLQRAVLDVLKLVIHNSKDNVEQIISKIDNEASTLVDNGNFLPSIKKKYRSAVSLFEKAKTEDIRLGDDAKTNDDVLTYYLDAAFSFDEISIEIFSRENDIDQAALRFDSIHRKGEVGGLIHHLKAHGVWYALVGIGGYLISLIPPLSWWKSLLG